MKNTLLLIPCMCGLILSGCAVAYDPVTGQTVMTPGIVVGGPVVYAEAEPPDVVYYTCDGVSYYFIDGRYCYFHGGRRIYIEALPHGGHLNHDYARSHAEFVRNHAGMARNRAGVTHNQPGVAHNQPGVAHNQAVAKGPQGKNAPQKGKASSEKKTDKQN